MKGALILYRMGALGVLLSFGVLGEEPLAGSLRQNPSSWVGVAILFGFTGLAGLFLLCLRYSWIQQDSRNLMFFSHGAALIAILWLILWCFVWLADMMAMGDKAEMFIKHTAYLHLFGVGFTMAGYATGWMTPRWGERSVRFLMSVAWAVSYMAWFNLFLQPDLKWLWAPAIGGLFAVLGAFLLSRRLKSAIVATKPLP
jgi:hypothetical protein